MKIPGFFLLAAAVVLTTAAAVSAQAIIQIAPNGPPRNSQTEHEITDEDLIHSVFDPVTDALNLTPAQKFRIVMIVSATMNSTEPLFDQLDEMEDQISFAALSGTLSDAKLKEISIRQAGVMAEINVTTAKAKANFYKVLTPQQRAMVLAQYRSEQNLGAISNVGP